MQAVQGRAVHSDTQLFGGAMEREVRITVDGREVPMNPFVRSMVVNIITAMIDSLKGADSSGRIEITLEEEEQRQ
jgi:hypothetical protein